MYIVLYYDTCLRYHSHIDFRNTFLNFRLGSIPLLNFHFGIQGLVSVLNFYPSMQFISKFSETGELGFPYKYIK